MEDEPGLACFRLEVKENCYVFSYMEVIYLSPTYGCTDTRACLFTDIKSQGKWEPNLTKNAYTKVRVRKKKCTLYFDLIYICATNNISGKLIEGSHIRSVTNPVFPAFEILLKIPHVLLSDRYIHPTTTPPETVANMQNILYHTHL